MIFHAAFVDFSSSYACIRIFCNFNITTVNFKNDFKFNYWFGCICRNHQSPLEVPCHFEQIAQSIAKFQRERVNYCETNLKETSTEKEIGFKVERVQLQSFPQGIW
jgi:hypothetical protein